MPRASAVKAPSGSRLSLRSSGGFHAHVSSGVCRRRAGLAGLGPARVSGPGLRGSVLLGPAAGRAPGQPLERSRDTCLGGRPFEGNVVSGSDLEHEAGQRRSAERCRIRSGRLAAHRSGVRPLRPADRAVPAGLVAGDHLPAHDDDAGRMVRDPVGRVRVRPARGPRRRRAVGRRPRRRASGGLRGQPGGVRGARHRGHVRIRGPVAIALQGRAGRSLGRFAALPVAELAASSSPQHGAALRAAAEKLRRSLRDGALQARLGRVDHSGRPADPCADLSARLRAVSVVPADGHPVAGDELVAGHAGRAVRLERCGRGLRRRRRTGVDLRGAVPSVAQRQRLGQLGGLQSVHAAGRRGTPARRARHADLRRGRPRRPRAVAGLGTDEHQRRRLFQLGSVAPVLRQRRQHRSRRRSCAGGGPPRATGGPGRRRDGSGIRRTCPLAEGGGGVLDAVEHAHLPVHLVRGPGRPGAPAEGGWQG